MIAQIADNHRSAYHRRWFAEVPRPLRRAMSSRFIELVVDCHDPERLAAFWCAVLDFKVIDRDEQMIEIGSWEPTAEQFRERQMPPTMLFIRVPEDKAVQKNRLHVDVSPIDRGRAEEVERLLALGASRVDIGQGERSWEVLADPEGNEFCVLRSLSVDDTANGSPPKAPA
jgi:hypothetical protein